MKKELSMVEEFHRSFRLPVRPSPDGNLSPDEYRLRHELMREENAEYLEACDSGDLTKVADALGDMLYVLCGTILTHGLHHKIEEVVAEIHRSNMSKLDAENQPVYRADGKILKSNRYFPPDIKGIIYGPE